MPDQIISFSIRNKLVIALFTLVLIIWMHPTKPLYSLKRNLNSELGFTEVFLPQGFDKSKTDVVLKRRLYLIFENEE